MSGWVSMRTLYIVAQVGRGAAPPLLRRRGPAAPPPAHSARDRPRDAAPRRSRAPPPGRLSARSAAHAAGRAARAAHAARCARAARSPRGCARIPERRRRVDDMAREAGASRRTLERLFQKETGMSLGRWRQQARLLHAMRLLARGEPRDVDRARGRLRERRAPSSPRSRACSAPRRGATTGRRRNGRSCLVERGPDSHPDYSNASS